MKKGLVLCLVGALLLLTGYGAGRFTAPHSVVTIDKTEQIKEAFESSLRLQLSSEYTEKLETMRQDFLRQQNVVVAKHTKKTVKPDGTIVIVHDETSKSSTTESTKTDSTTKTNTEKVATETEKNLKAITESAKTESSKTTIFNKPTYRVGFNIGVDAKGMLEKRTFSGVGSSGLIFGGTVDKRVIGPLFFGVWANSRGEGGIGASLEF